MKSLNEIKAILQHCRTNMPCLKLHGVIKTLHPDCCFSVDVFLLNVSNGLNNSAFHFLTRRRSVVRAAVTAAKNPQRRQGQISANEAV